VDGKMVFGEGARRGIMFIGEGPGSNEEVEGRPFVGPSGQLLRKVLTFFGAPNVYISNTVICRSAAPVLDPQGNPRFRGGKFGKPKVQLYRDEPPLPVHVETCKPRLYEEIYLVDPVIIVSLGVPASEMLLQRPVAITKERGTTHSCDIPGVFHRAKLTEKKKEWVRKVRGEVVMPTEQNMVRYLVLPTLHPAYVLRKHADHGPNNPFQQFRDDIRLAVKIYERYQHETHGIVPTGASDTPDDVISKQIYDTEEADE
jgi:uracil-DNA glycosylase